MIKHRGEGFQKPLSGEPQPVGIAIVRTSGDTITCSCGGFAKRHARQKVREDAAQRHLNRRHYGQGMWL